jgi:hypothetical protein
MELIVMHKSKYGLLTLALVLAGGSLWAWWHFRGDPEVARVRALGAQLRTESKDLSEDKRRELWGQFGEEVRKLSPDQRHSLFADQRQRGEERARQELKNFFALSAADRQKALDKQIDEGERRKKEAQKRRSQQTASGTGQLASAQWGGMRGAPGSGRGQNRTAEEKSARRNQMLDQSSPEDRAMRAEYRRLVGERRRQRGLPANPRRGFV